MALLLLYCELAHACPNSGSKRVVDRGIKSSEQQGSIGPTDSILLVFLLRITGEEETNGVDS